MMEVEDTEGFITKNETLSLELGGVSLNAFLS